MACLCHDCGRAGDHLSLPLYQQNHSFTACVHRGADWDCHVAASGCANRRGYGKLPDSLPVFLLPDVPLNLQTLLIILPYSAGLAVVGLLESMMTATIVDDMTDTPSDKTGSAKLRASRTSAHPLSEEWQAAR